ncbi:response regulator [Leptothermofonsia sichuanensis E412]|uniref:response regulator n=1 Tax=Leptothermofonsia sichuanensis TaxID=2917832 RepID=UPI001CA60265|nr:response regulator [Leptothermofonsia sichuanensis]QZZ19699.1 response regulator [Leptothermofonsia sichuanensis E412]
MNQSNVQGSYPGEILVVDDTVVNLKLLSTLLRREGYDVRCATSGEMALRSTQFSPPNLILLDINLPEMDGYEVCRRLKSDPATARIPVIFISALDTSSAREQAFAVGGLDYIAKPYRIQDVLSRVGRVLNCL